MLDTLILFSIRHKLLIGLFVFGLVVWGGISVVNLPIDAVPDITNNQVQVLTVTPSLGATDVERLITFPIEQAIATIPKVENVRSFSRFGLSVITIVFPDETDIYWARQQVAERLAKAAKEIPAGVGQPEMAPVTTGLGEIYQYILRVKEDSPKKYTLMELRTIQDWMVRRQLLGTKGLADVSGFGGYERQVEVAVDPERLMSYRVTLAEVFSALERNNQNTGGAYIEKQNSAYFIRAEGLAASAEDIEAMVVRPAMAGISVPLLIRDVATVQDGHAPRYGLMTRNDEGEVVGGLVLMLKGANSSEVIGNVKERIATIQRTLPKGIVIEPFLDRTKLVNHSIHTVLKNLAEGALIVVLVLVLFLGNLRAGLVVASVIPLSMLFAVGMMGLFGVSGNLLSLGAIDFGLIVDGAVIIVEAILHRLAIQKVLGIRTRSQMDQEVYEASTKIRSSSSFGEIIILIVYLPLLALGGIEGKMFRPMAQTVAFAILGAFILSFTYVPMASALFLSRKPQRETLSDRILASWGQAYKRLVGRLLRMKAAVVISAVLLLIGSVWLFGTLGGEFLPTLEEGDFAIETRVLPGSSITYTKEKAQQAAGILKKNFPEVKEVVAKVGSSSIPTDPMPIEACDLMVILKDQEEWTSAKTRVELAEKMADKLSNVPGVTFGFQQPIQMRFNELISGARQDVVIKIYGEDLNEVDGYAQKVGQTIKSIAGIEDLYVERSVGLTQIVAHIRRDRLAHFGLNVEDVNKALQTGFAGAVAGQIFDLERRFDVVVRLQEGNRTSIEDVKRLFLPTSDGRQVPLEQVADVEYVTGPSQIQRDNAQRRIIVGFNVRGRDVQRVVEEAQSRLEKEVTFKPGYYTTYGGQFENLQSATNRLLIAVPIALFLIFLLLYVTFGSVIQATLVFTAIPLSAVGGVVALWARGMPFSISAGVGFIALFGVAVLNGIVLITYLNQLKAEGWADLEERILEGAAVRLRPVLMTATVASLGFLPMALATTSGAEVQKPLATVVIGGLISATLLTLLVLPILYALSETKRRGQKKGTVILIVVFVSISSLMAKAQTPPEILSEAKAIELALTHNGIVQTAAFQLQAQEFAETAARDIGRTTVSAAYGQYNTVNNDNIFQVLQPFAWPGYYKAAVGVARAQRFSQQVQRDIAKAEVRRQVRTTYLKAVFAQSVAVQLRKQDSLYTEFVRIADARFRTGEAARLESIIASLALNDNRVKIDEIIVNEKNAIRQLAGLLQVSTRLSLADTSLKPISFTPQFSSQDTAGIENLLLAKALRQQVDINQAQTKFIRTQQKPGLTLGYQNQSIIGNQVTNGVSRDFSSGYRFQGISAAMTLPLWQKPIRARLQGALASEKAAQATLQRIRVELAAQIEVLLAQRAQQQKRLAYFEEIALPQALQIIQLAGKAYKAGEQTSTEYVLNLERAYRLQADYLDLIRQHNITVYELEYLFTPAE